MIGGYVDTTGFDVFTEEMVGQMEGPERTKALRELAFSFVSRVVPRTPVDTGRARAGWTAVPRTSQLASGPGAAEGRQMSDYIERGKNTKNFSIQIWNGVPYIAYLELGSSQQAPQGFIRFTLREMMAKARAEILEPRLEAMLRAANIKARAAINLRQGLGPRKHGGRANWRAKGL